MRVVDNVDLCQGFVITGKISGITKYTTSIGWKFLNHTKKCYKHFTSSVSWAEARHLCQYNFPNKKGDLASVPDQVTNDFLDKILSGVTKGVLIGGYKDPVNGQWKWSDGTPFSWPPNSIQDNQDRELAVLRTNYKVDKNGPGVWKDSLVSRSASYVCQYEAGRKIIDERSLS